MNIGGLQRFSLTDFPGKVAAIIFTQGCNFNCPFCHNPQLLTTNAKPSYTEKEVLDYLKTRQGQLDGVVITGGEPTIQDDLADFILCIKKLNFLVKLDTNGSHPKVLASLIKEKLVDYIAMDIKAPFSLYNKLAGVDANIVAIKESITLILQSGLPYTFRTTWAKSLLSDHDIETIRRELPEGAAYRIQEEVGT